MTRSLRRLAAAGLAAATVGLVPAVPARADEIRDQQWHLAFLHVDEAHRYSQGDGVVVGLVDSGVDANHPDLAGNVLAGTDISDPARDGRTDQDYAQGHGTGMAGFIAAHGHGGNTGALGIAPKAKILPVASGPGHRIFGDDGAKGVRWAADHGARVICFAGGGEGSDDEAMRAAIKEAFAHDVVVVAAVGNRPEVGAVAFPARYDGVVAAAGVDEKGEHAAVSVTGPAVVLSAPAVDTVSTLPDNGYGTGVGTSAATAIIAGAAALVRARFPNLSAKEVIHRLTATAIDKGPPGRDDQYGYGIVNLVGALTADVPPLQASATPQPTASAHAARPHRNSIALPVAAVAVLIAAGSVLLVWRTRR